MHRRPVAAARPRGLRRLRAAALVGTSTLGNPGTGVWTHLRFGRCDGHGVGAGMTGDLRFDDLIVDTTDVTFPLGPR